MDGKTVDINPIVISIRIIHMNKCKKSVYFKENIGDDI